MVLPRHMRLRGYRCFDYLHREAIRFYGPSMVLRVAKSKPFLEKERKKLYNQDTLKCAISISNKVSKKAVIRNSLRRSFHEHLKNKFQNYKEIKSTWAFITLKPNCIKEELDALLNECDQLLLKARLIS